MNTKETFIEKLDEFELTNHFDISSEEIHAIMKVCESDDDPLYLSVWLGFQCGCMKAGAKHE